MGVLEATRWDVPNFTKDVPNFVKNVLDFVKDVPRVPKCVLRWGSAPNHFLISSKMQLWIIHVQMGGPGPQSLPYKFQNAIMDHPCSNGGSRKQ